LLHYPSNSYPQDLDHLGIMPHSDFECFTILAASGPGLQIMNSSDEWLEVPPLNDAFIINIGDLLEIWTNGVFKATAHRVANMQSIERFSIAFFAAADYHVIVEPLSAFVSAENPARYERIVAGHYLASFAVHDTPHLRRRVKSGELKLTFTLAEESSFSRKAVNEFQG
jgi:isopenicillin N synthase-like dioxygenase